MAPARFGWEPLERLLAEPNVPDMIRQYAEELSPIRHIARPDIDWDELVRRDRLGTFAVWAARSGPTLAGFISFYIEPHLFYRTTLFAVDAGHYLAPAFRDNDRIGFRMWRTVEVPLKERGVIVIMAHDNAERPLMPFFLALDYHPRSTMFWRVLRNEK